jgi:hypothetical protein
MWYVTSHYYSLIIYDFMKILCMILILIPFYITNISWHINPYLAVLQTKSIFSCPFCVPKMKSYRSRILGKEVFDE